MPDALPYSQACENNKVPILQVLRRHLPGHSPTLAPTLTPTLTPTPTGVLEIGGGTGQHGAFFAEQIPALHWQSSDVPANVDSLNLRIAAAALPNLPPTIALDVNDLPWPIDGCDCIFSANSLHIMSADSVVRFFDGAGSVLNPGGKLLVYGPFKYGGEFTTESNARFDVWLKNQDPVSGVRDFEWVNELAATAGLSLLEDNAMPANNQLLVWEKLKSEVPQ